MHTCTTTKACIDTYASIEISFKLTICRKNRITVNRYSVVNFVCNSITALVNFLFGFWRRVQLGGSLIPGYCDESRNGQSFTIHCHFFARTATEIESPLMNKWRLTHL